MEHASQSFALHTLYTEMMCNYFTNYLAYLAHLLSRLLAAIKRHCLEINLVSQDATKPGGFGFILFDVK